MAQSVITEKEIRMFMLDRPELNTLIDQVKFSSEDIEQAVINVVDRFNILPPPVGGYSVESFPSRSLLCLGVAAWLLKGAAIGDALNQLDYSAAGVQVNDRNKAELYLTIGNDLWKEFNDTAQNIKMMQSVNRAYGNHGSEYGWRYF